MRPEKFKFFSDWSWCSNSRLSVDFFSKFESTTFQPLCFFLALETWCTNHAKKRGFVLKKAACKFPATHNHWLDFFYKVPTQNVPFCGEAFPEIIVDFVHRIMILIVWSFQEHLWYWFNSVFKLIFLYKYKFDSSNQNMNCEFQTCSKKIFRSKIKFFDAWIMILIVWIFQTW